ncbi:MAG: hypothetical protein KBD29_01825 [Candidatus Magasanikbacteria bacterium]|nr:hypothetical protein [Candidatus Magasanikbacteria bacterium]
MTQQEYHELLTVLEEKVVTSTPRVALSYLQELMEENQKILRACHGLVHAIGHAAYLKYDFSEAMQYQDDLCGSGYIHGVVESSFKDVPDIFYALKNVCKKFNGPLGTCYHGVGHGLMYYTDNDLPQAISYCNTYTNRDQQIRCAEGVYMENFSTESGAHESIYLREEDPLYPCAEQPANYRQVCYFYSPIYYLTLHPNAYTDALQWCSEAGNYTAACVRGVGSRVSKENIHNPKFMEDMCTSDPTHTTLCIDGMVSYYLVHFASLSKAREMCDLLEPENQSACQEAIKIRTSEFPE